MDLERDQIAERTKGALSHMRNQGKRISGKIHFGYDLAPDKENLLLNPEEQIGLHLIHRLRAKWLGRRRIAAQLIRRGIPTKTGSSWSPQAVGNIQSRAEIQRSLNIDFVSDTWIL